MKLALCAAVSIYALAQAPLALAADAVAPLQQVPEVVVTAQRRSESIQKVPMSVEAVSAATIRSRGIANLDDLQNEVVGVKFGHFSGGDNITIRGVGSAFVSGAGQSSVAVYVDGVYQSQIESLGMGQSDLAGIEVLKGPQGTLYGRNSNGGVINISSAKPTDALSYGASIGYGNYNHIDEQGYVSGPVTDRLRLRLFVQNDDQQGYITNIVTGQKLGGVNSIGGRISLDADVTSRWKAELRISSWKDNYAGPVYDGNNRAFYFLPGTNDFNPYAVATPVHYGSARTNSIVSLKNTVHLTDQIRLVATTGFDDFINNEHLDALGNATVPLPIKIQRRADEFTQEINLVGETSKVKWIAGAFFLNEVVHQRNATDETNIALYGTEGAPPTHIDIGPQASSIVQHGHLQSVETSASVFGDVTYSLTDSTRVYTGLRGTYDKLRITMFEGIGAFAPPTNSCDPVMEGDDDTSMTGRVGAEHDISRSSMLYAQYSHGYKSPGFSQSTCNNPFKAEIIDAVEIGYKSQWFDRRLTFNTDAFHYGYDNLQLEQATLTGIPVVNAPQAHIWGFEAGVVLRPINDLRFDAGVVLLDASYDRFWNQDPNNGVASCGVGSNPSTGAGCPAAANLKGVQLNNAPKAAGNVGAEFDQHLGGFGTITWRAEVSLTDSYHVREFNEPWTIQPAYAKFNLYASYVTDDGHYQLRGYVKNLNNVAVLSGELGYGAALSEFEMPRTYGVEASVKF
ncbi:MAG TPA: TonB-dependent receptor [Caulobacteraceae bacterium]